MNKKQNNTMNKLGRVLAVPSFANYTLAFALQLRKKHGKTSVRVAEEIQRMHIVKTRTHYKTHPYTQTHKHPHITIQFKTTTVQTKKTQYKVYPNEIITI
jgi:hypothetical protein